MKNTETIDFTRTKRASLQALLNKGRSFLLLGPRQTGKSTLLRKIFDDLPQKRCLSYDLTLPSDRRRLEDDPEAIVREVEAVGGDKPLWIFIDEFQKTPQIMDPLQHLLDRKRIVLAASGSSARKMRRLGTNWLPGRVRLEHLFPLTWKETGFPDNRFDEVLRFGLLPGILNEGDLSQREADLAAYTNLYLEEEIRQEAVVRNVPRFAQFLKLAALESGSAPNFSKIGQHVGLSHTSIREYFQILDDTMVIHRLPAFGSNRDAVLRTAKYYFFDIGVRNAAADIGHSKGIITLQIGLLFEHFVVLQAFALTDGRAELTYWRTPQGREVDLIVERQSRRIPIEIKATEKPKEDDFSGLHVFAKKHRCKEGYLVCRVGRPQKFGNFTAMPWSRLPELLS